MSIYHYQIKKEKISAIPNTFTSNDSIQGYLCSASSEDGGNPAWRAWKRDYTTSEWTWWTGSYPEFPVWFQIEVPEAFIPSAIKIANEVASPENFQNEIFQGSTNGSTWTNLYTITDWPNTAGYSRIIELSTSTAFKYFRLYITESHSDGVSIQGMEIFKEKSFITGFDDFGFPMEYDSADSAGCSATEQNLVFYLDSVKGIKDLSKEPVTITNNGVTISDDSFVFDGDSYMTTNNSSKLNFGSGDFTIDIVMNLSVENEERPYPTIIGGIDGWNTGANGLRWNGTHKREAFCVFLNPGDPLLASNTTFTPNNNTFIKYTVQRKYGVFEQYFDGVKDTNTVINTNEFNLCHNTGMSIGRSSWDGWNGYHIGKIKSIKIYNVAKY